MVRIDGRTRQLDASGEGITLTLGPEPILLHYESATNDLSANLGAPAATLDLTAADDFVLGTTGQVRVKLTSGVSADLVAPPLWKVEPSTDTDTARFAVTPPEQSRAREADLLVSLMNPEGAVVGALSLRPRVTQQLSVRILPEPSGNDTKPAVRLILTNSGTRPLRTTWEIALTGEMALKNGKFDLPEATTIAFSGPISGTMELPAGKVEEVVIPLPDASLTKLYRAKALAKDEVGNVASDERYVGGFVGVPRVAAPPHLDGTLDEPAWQQAPTRTINQANHMYSLKPTATWKGPEDLSGTMRFLWDEQHLYVGVEVTDDVAGPLKQDAQIWNQDGLQFLIDPARGSARKPGKYDYAIALGAKGAQAWSYLTADGAKAPINEAKDIRVTTRRADPATGNITYEVAIPWTRISPFVAQPGANLGLTMVLNEADDKGRVSFLTWFGNAHTKQVDTAGDLILLK